MLLLGVASMSTYIYWQFTLSFKKHFLWKLNGIWLSFEVCVHWHSLPFVKHIFISSLFCWTLFLSCLSIPFNLMKSHCLLVIGNGTLPMNWTLTRVKCAASSHSLLSYQCSVSVTRQKYCIVILIFNTLTLNFESFALKLLV